MKNQITVTKFLFVFCALFFSISAHAAGARAAFDKYRSGFKTLEAAFEQSLTNEKGKVMETAQGVVYLQRPNLFRWEYTKPYLQSIIGDGEKVWVYDQDLEQVTVRPMHGVMNSTPAIILGAEGNLEDRFAIAEADDKDGAQWVTLTPKTAKHDYQGIGLGFEGDTLRWMVLRDNFGQITTLKFVSQTLDPKLPPDNFQFTPPAGVDVNDLSQPAPAAATAP